MSSLCSTARSRASVGWGAAVERTDAFLRRFPVAGLSLLVLAIVFGAAMLAAAGALTAHVD